MLDKRIGLDSFIDRLRDETTIGIGGWATRRKPMALVRAIAQSTLKDLTVVAYGGPDVGMLAASGKLKKLIFGFVSLDHIPIDPHFKTAREAGLSVLELDEGMVHWGLRAAAMRLPFLPSRMGIATDIAKQSELKTVRSPYGDAEELLAMPAIKLDVALIHVHRADQLGNAVTLSPDPFFDELMARAADQVFISTEKLVSTEELGFPKNIRYNPFERNLVSAVIEAPFGAHPTDATPDYGIDLKHLQIYAAATSPDTWSEYRTKFIEVTPQQYLSAVGGAGYVSALPSPIY